MAKVSSRPSSPHTALPIKEGSSTNLLRLILDERVPPRFALGGSGLVEEVVELGDLAVLGADLDEGVPGEGGESAARSAGGARNALVD